MKLGFVTAIVPELSLEQVFAFAAIERFACVELMCWPPGKADRKYAGVTHLDVTAFGPSDAAVVSALANKYGVGISGLGYYPNPLDPDPDHRQTVVEHLRKVIRAAALLGVGVVNTFIGRDPAQTVEANLLVVPRVWNPIVELARAVKVKIGNRALTQYHDGKSGYLAQSSLPLYFGLGTTPKADRIEVLWPSGKRQVVKEKIPENGLIQIIENGE